MSNLGCRWREDEDGNWWTTCGEGFVLNEGTPRQNRMNFCSYCGGNLIQEPYSEAACAEPAPTTTSAPENSGTDEQRDSA